MSLFNNEFFQPIAQHWHWIFPPRLYKRCCRFRLHRPCWPQPRGNAPRRAASNFHMFHHTLETLRLVGAHFHWKSSSCCEVFLLVCSIQTDPLEKAPRACAAYLTSRWGRLAFHWQQPRPGLNGPSVSNFWQGRALTRWFAFPLPLALCQCCESSPTSRTATRTGSKAALCDPHFLYKDAERFF